MGGKVVLSRRMQAVADMVTTGNRVVDVGCDHGYVSIYLVQQKRTTHALAMDINNGPLLRAREHVEEAGLEGYITLRLSDGLGAFRKGEADTLICAGMGGRLMQRILEREPDKTESLKELVLQPQSEIASFRYYLTDAGYRILEETMVLEEGKFYPVIKAVQTEKEGRLSYTEARFGPELLRRRHPVLREYLYAEWEKGLKLEQELMAVPAGERVDQRLVQIRQEMSYIKQAMEIVG